MKKGVIVLLVLVVFSIAVVAQVPAPPPTPSEFDDSDGTAEGDFGFGEPYEISDSPLEERVSKLESDVQNIYSELRKTEQAPLTEGLSPLTTAVIVFIAIILMASAVLGFYFFRVIKKGKPKAPDALKNYIRNGVNRGYPIERMKLQLLSSGWKEEQIESAHEEVLNGA